MSQPQRQTHAERTDKSDRLMLKAAIDLIVERGTDKTTLKEVGEHAGYSRGLAGYRFGSKSGLFEYIVRCVGEEWLQDLKRVTHGLTGYSAVEAAVREHCRFCLEASSSVRAFYILWFESIGVQSPVKAVIAGIHERRRRDVIDWIQAASVAPELPADFIADHFNAAVLGVAYQWLANPEDRQRIEALHDNLATSMRKLLEPNSSGERCE